MLPPLCWQCENVLGGRTFLDPASLFLCSSCLLELPWTDQAYHCRQCGNHTAEPNRLRCQECIEHIWELDQTRSVFAYDDIVRHWILQLKFYGKEHFSPLLGCLLALSFQNSNCLEKNDILIPIPLHSSLLRKRGFNQSLLLAYYFKKNLGKSAPELQTHWLRRIRASRPQTELPLAERLENYG